MDDAVVRVGADPDYGIGWWMGGRVGELERGTVRARAAVPGTPISFGGIDVWRIENGKVVEYWVASDGLHLMAQLGAGD